MIEVKNKKKNFHLSILILILVLVLTGGLYGYNYYIWELNAEKDAEVNQLDSQISQAKKNKEILVSTLLFANKTVLKQLEKRNDLAYFITHLDIVARSYNLEFEGFNYRDGTISSKVTFQSKVSDIVDSIWVDKTLAYKDSVTFIQKYREDTQTPFHLEFIPSISGTDVIDFPVNFRLK